MAGMRQVAGQAAEAGRFDAVIHNPGLGPREPRRVGTDDGLAQVFAVNVLAPYLLTALAERPGRLVYLSSGLHRGGHARLDDAQWPARRSNAAARDTACQDELLGYCARLTGTELRGTELGG